MNYYKLFFVLCAMFCVFDSADFIVTGTKMKTSKNLNLNLSKRNTTKLKNPFGKYSKDVTLYLSYTFDPFGPSRRIINPHNKNRTRNFMRAAQFWNDENAVDTGQNQIYREAYNYRKSLFSSYKNQSIDQSDIDFTTDIMKMNETLINALNSTEKNSLGYNKTMEMIAILNKHRVHKRGVLHLYNMVKCATGCNPISYKGYGCYCGFLGNGHAVDGIDRCCKFHDWCYDTAGCPPFFTYIMPYYWRCYRNKAFCAIDHGEFGGPGSCAQRLCECDRILSDCLSRYPCPRSRALCYSNPLRLLQNKLMF